jgi:hypothetical protein
MEKELPPLPLLPEQGKLFWRKKTSFLESANKFPLSAMGFSSIRKKRFQKKNPRTLLTSDILLCNLWNLESL